jgi:TPR repeat protein
MAWHGMNINEREAVSWYRKSAEQNFSDAEYNLGAMYEDGKGVTVDLEEAFRWYRRGAEDGSTGSMAAYARFLLNGVAGEPNESDGIKWLMRGADKEHPLSMYRLAKMIEENRLSSDQSQDYDIMKLYRKAAEEEHVDAQFEYGLKLIAAERRQEGIEYLRKAADSDHEDAQAELDKLGD